MSSCILLQIAATYSLRFNMNFSLPYQNKIILFLLLLLAIITIYPFWEIGFATADDLSYYEIVRSGHLWNFSYQSAFYHGRFYYAFSLPVYYLPYAFDNFVYTKIIQYTSMVMCVYTFSVLIKKITRSPELGMLFLVFFLAALSLSCWTSLIVAYLFYFNFSFTLISFSLILLINYYETKKKSLLWYTAIVYFIGLLFYEIYLLYLLIAAIIILIFRKREQKEKSIAFQYKLFFKEISIFVSIGLLYLAIYIAFYLLFPSSYGGNSIANDRLTHENIEAVLINFSESAFPLSVYYQNTDFFKQINENGHQNNLWYIVTQGKPDWIIKAILICLLFSYLIRRVPKLTTLTFAGLLLSSLILIYLTHLPLAISQKYGLEFYFIKGYVTTYFSFFGVALLLTLIIYLLYQLATYHKILQAIVIVAGIFYLFECSIKTSYSNYYIAKDMARTKRAFDVIDLFCSWKKFNEIPSNAMIYAEDLWESSSTQMRLYDQGFQWQNYIYLKTKRQLLLVRDYATFYEAWSHTPNTPAYYLSRREPNKKSKDLLLVFSKIDASNISPDSIKLLSNQADLFCISFKKQKCLSFHLAADSVDNVSVRKNDHHYCLKNMNPSQITMITQIKAPNIELKSIAISDSLKGDRIVEVY
ncbi:MAG TPA: hypothetical protein VNB90_09180 [Cytophagaceae bacterium]|nr:hypothetical protein [Cytophagaceae bacterium]